MDIRAGDVYRATSRLGGSGLLYTVVKVTDQTYTYTTTTTVNTVAFGDYEPFPTDYFERIYRVF